MIIEDITQAQQEYKLRPNKIKIIHYAEDTVIVEDNAGDLQRCLDTHENGRKGDNTNTCVRAIMTFNKSI